MRPIQHLILGIILGIFCTPAILQGQSITVTPESKTVGIGDTISVDINLSGFSGELGTAQGTLEWDPDVLFFDSTLPNALSNFGLFGMQNSDFGLTDVLQGRIYIGWTSAGFIGYVPAPVWFTMKFIVVGNVGSSSTIELTDGPQPGGTPVEFSEFNFPAGFPYFYGISVVTNQGIISIGAGFPVTWSSLDASKTDGGMKVSWETASELNNDFFAVERMMPGGTFVEMGQVEGVGTSDVPQAYSFLDADAPEGKLFYRIRQVDLDGAVDYSNTIEAFNIDGGFRLFPNPVKDYVTIALPESYYPGGRVILRDLRGAAVKEVSFTNTTEVVFPVADQPEGCYLIELAGNHGNRARRSIVKY